MKQCKKQTTIAIIMKDGEFISMGSNEIHVDVDECPRDEAGYKSGEGYDLCKDVCNQKAHAEVAACHNAAGNSAVGATLYLIGHTYCCDNCIDVMADNGIKNVIIADDVEDSKRLDKLQALTHGYGNGWILRPSTNNRGMRLHETSTAGAVPDVRDAIDNFE